MMGSELMTAAGSARFRCGYFTPNSKPSWVDTMLLKSYATEQSQRLVDAKVSLMVRRDLLPANPGPELYLLPFTPALRPHFKPRELRDWAELMTERGIRIRVPFEQFWDPNEEDEAFDLPENEDLEED